MQEEQSKFGITSFWLHILAMLFMVCDHTWAAMFNQARWLTCIGRISFPIFAFLLVEGFYHTSDIKKYIKRLLIFAIISEVPFDLFYSGVWFDIFHQNVLWTFIIALCGIAKIDKIRKENKKVKTVILTTGIVLLCTILGIVLMPDFFAPGVLTVFVFYFFHKRSIIGFIGQLLCLAYINIELSGGFYYPITILGHEIEFIEQSLALLALIPIWLYKGKQGYYNKGFKYFCYSFYPVHLLIFAMIELM